MMNIVQSFLFGLMLAFLLFCLFWAGIYSSYMQYYGIREFFNPFFANVFNPIAFFGLAVLFGIGFLLPFVNVLVKILFFLALVFCLLLFTVFGRSVGHMLLSNEHFLTVNGAQQVVQSLYENPYVIVYLSAESEDFETRKNNLVYYPKEIKQF